VLLKGAHKQYLRLHGLHYGPLDTGATALDILLKRYSSRQIHWAVHSFTKLSDLTVTHGVCYDIDAVRKESVESLQR